jgi:hypothetical protein
VNLRQLRVPKGRIESPPPFADSRLVGYAGPGESLHEVEAGAVEGVELWGWGSRHSLILHFWNCGPNRADLMMRIASALPRPISP